MFKIYKIVYDNQIIYIGSTTHQLVKRKNNGYRFISKNILIDSKWILIEETNDKLREQFWIDYFRKMNCELFNKINVIGSSQHEYYLRRKMLKPIKQREKKIKIKKEKKVKEKEIKIWNINLPKIKPPIKK